MTHAGTTGEMVTDEETPQGAVPSMSTEPGTDTGAKGQTEATLQTEEPGGGGESLLVVDDDPFIARLLEIELKAAGYDVRVGSDGEQALVAGQEPSARPPA